MSATDTTAEGSLVALQQHNTEATSTSMRFWARSIGERNPRFVNESYAPAGGSRYMAHPCWLYSVHDTAVDVGRPGEVAILAGTDWSFFRPVVMGDRIATAARLVAQRPVNSRFAGPALLQTVEVQYVDAHDQLIAVAMASLLRVDPEQSREFGKKKFADWKRYKYTHAELDAIEAGYDAERVRGATPRYFEDVLSGEVVPPLVRGPVTSEEIILFVGATRPIPAVSTFTHERVTGKLAGFIHPSTGTYEAYAAGLVDDPSAQQLGYPAAFDYGIDRISQMGSMVTNWMGDAGRLVGLNARLLAPNFLGDTTWFRGTVTRSERHTPRSGLVVLDVAGSNQRGEVTVAGSACVELPLRSPDWAALARLG